MRRRVVYCFGSFFVLAACLLAASGIADALLQDKESEIITPGVKVHGIDIGGLTRQAAAVYLSGYFKELALQPVEVVYGTQSWQLIPRDCGVEVDVEAVLQSAVNTGKDGSFIARWRMRRKAQKYGTEIPVYLSVNEGKLAKALKLVTSQVERSPLDARFVVRDNRVEVVPASQGIKVDWEALKQDFLAASRSTSARYVQLVTIAVEPRLSTEAAIAMGISHRIASYRTEFDPTDYDRNHNIRLAAGALKGVIVAPGEVFSFNKATGPRFALHGYRPAPVIVDGELLPGIGGGVCQVSTTLYNVLLLSDLQVVNRVPHSLPVKYVPLGQDAAVAYNYLDLEFINTLPYHILIDTIVTDNSLEISLYSHPSAARNIRLESKVLGIIEPDTVEVLDPLLSPGKRVEAKPGRRGYRVAVFQVEVDAAGKEVSRKLVSQTVYNPRDRIVRVGPSTSPAMR